jgi:hypothetical protein
MILSNWRKILGIAAASLAIAWAGAAQAADPIVGTWVGDVTQPDVAPFETRLSFVSPKGGVSRYPSFPCGGLLQGDRKGDSYEYNETIIWGGVDERTDGCIGGTVKVEVNGNKMKFDWSTTYNGKDYTASGELRRVK